jgi:S-DNA-T family DNA segregation ATPase FtsK/SpoIIIE
MSQAPERPPPLRLLRGDQARGPGDEPDPYRVQRPGSDGVIAPGGERMANDQERAGVLDVRGEVELPEEYDAERASDDLEIVTDRPVDLPEQPLRGVILPRGEPQRQPILPGWTRSRADATAAARHHADLVWYRIRYHLAHSPKYVGAVAFWAPVGAAKLLGRLARWAWHAESADLRRAAATPGGDVNAYLRLEQQRGERIRVRMPVAGAAITTTVGGSWLAIALLPKGWLILLSSGLATLLAKIGRPVDRPILGPAVTVPRRERLTAERVRQALIDLRLAGMKDPKRITFPMEIHRDGPGQLARVNLPPGVEAVDVCEKREALSSALRLPVDQVWLSVGPDHAGQVDIWVGYQPASKMKPPAWSLLKDGARTSVFEPADFGADQRQRPVATILFARNWLIGGVPGSGKSYFARALALAAALDPTVEFKIAEFKGTADFGDFDAAGLCSDYYCGVDDEALAGGAEIIAWGLAEAERRGRRIRAFREAGRAPEGKVTPELAAEHGSGLHPVVILIDEAHELLVDPEVATAAERLIKRGRALGLIVILATQIPDAKSVPPIITRCVTMRACLAVQDHIANDMILGTGSYRRGVTATSYRPGDDAGWGMVTGLKAPTAVRSQFPTPEEAKTILTRAVELRGGVIPRSEGDAPRLDVLIDVQRVWPDQRPGLHWVELAERLAEVYPDRYGDETAETISARLRALEVPSVDVKAGGRSAKGCRWDAIEEARARRELGHG